MEENQEFNGLFLSNLEKIKRWTKFLSILSYVFTVLVVLAAVAVGIFGTSATGFEAFVFAGPIFILFYLLGAGLYYFTAKFLGDMSNSSKMALLTSETSHIETLIAATAKLFSFWGIITAVVLGLYLLSIIGAIFLGIAGLG